MLFLLYISKLNSNNLFNKVLPYENIYQEILFFSIMNIINIYFSIFTLFYKKDVYF